MMRRFLKNWQPGPVVYNPLNTGDGHKMAAAVGAHIVPRKDLGAESAAHIRFIRPPPIFFQKIPPYPLLTRMMVFAMKVAPSWAIRPIMMKFLTTTLGPDRGVFEEGAILVNKLGERFADERRTPNMLIPQQPDGMAYIVFDDQFAKKFSRWPHFISTAPGVAFAFIDDYRVARPDLFNQAPTLEALSQKIGFRPDRLKAAVASANDGRPKSQQLTAAPFYALGPVQTFVMVAPVGLSVSMRLEVLAETGVPIPGLYAVGNAGQAGFTVTGHGHGLGWAFTSGRLAAQQVVARVGAT
jgi:fumarate reductase flavoprotein subunit